LHRHNTMCNNHFTL